MISVIVPVYNTKEYLRRCVKSLTDQDYENKEILLVDDGSTDGSGELCDDYERNNSDIRVLHKENGGLMSAWIEGVKASRGEYLCFVDSDDFVEPCMLKEMASFLTGAEKEIVVCNYSIDRENGEKTLQVNGLSPGIYDRKALEKEVFLQLLGNETRTVSFSRCMKLISKELILDNLKFCNYKIRMGEDLNIMLPALLDAQRLVIMEKAYYYHYFFNQSSIVHKYDAGLYDNIKLLYQVMESVISEKFEDNERRRAMKRRADMEYLFLLMLVLKNEARGNKEGYQKNIKAVCRDAGELIQNTPIKAASKAGRLLYSVMKHPNSLMIWLLRLSLKLYDR